MCHFLEILVPFTDQNDTQKFDFLQAPPIVSSLQLRQGGDFTPYHSCCRKCGERRARKSWSGALSEAGGSGKGEAKEMNTVCGGSSPRDHPIKTTELNYTVPHREWTPLSASPITHPLSYTHFFFLWSVSHIPTYPQRKPHLARTHTHERFIT